MRLFLAASTLALTALAGPIVAQPMNNAMPGAASATPAVPATPADPATPANPAMPADPAAGMPATPATPATPALPADPARPGVPADSAAAATMPPGTPTTVDNTLPAPPAAAMNKTYPVCTRSIQDNCQNPGEGGAAGRSRAKRHRG